MLIKGMLFTVLYPKKGPKNRYREMLYMKYLFLLFSLAIVCICLQLSAEESRQGSNKEEQLSQPSPPPR